jgi:hypothetical protein
MLLRIIVVSFAGFSIAGISTTGSSTCARAFNSRRRAGDNPGIEKV